MNIEKLLVTDFVDFFQKKESNDDQRFLPIFSSVCCVVLNTLYKRFINTKEIQPIELISEEKKNKYWDLAKKFNKKPNEWVLAAKAAYMLELVTSTFEEK